MHLDPRRLIEAVGDEADLDQLADGAGLEPRMLREAWRAERRLDQPAQKVWRVAIGAELGRGPAVAERVALEPIDLNILGSNDRIAALHFDLARSWAQAEGARDGEAIRHLDAADRLAPVRLRNDPIARDLVTTLDRRAPRRVWELDSLRNRFGLGKVNNM